MIAAKVIAELDAFTPAEEAENVGRLYEILEGLQPLAPDLRLPVVPAIFGLIERYPEAELGSPGPLVHELESIPGYESFLQDSVSRQPAPLSIWMVNRVLNAEIPSRDRSVWLQALQVVLNHQSASEKSRQTARDFLEHQD
jgi:hypothetical protein